MNSLTLRQRAIGRLQVGQSLSDLSLSCLSALYHGYVCTDGYSLEQVHDELLRRHKASLPGRSVDD